MEQVIIKLAGGDVKVHIPHYRQNGNEPFYKVISSEKAIKVLNPKHSDIFMGREIVNATAAFDEDSRSCSEGVFNSAHFYVNARIENLLK
jgi:hypothetical protein